MAIDYEFEVAGDLLKVKTRGVDENLAEVQDYGGAVMAAAVEHGCTRVLCDERELQYRLGTVDTFRLAEEAASLVPSLYRIALVCSPEGLADGIFYETVATNRGLTVRVFENMDAAAAWITAE